MPKAKKEYTIDVPEYVPPSPAPEPEALKKIFAFLSELSREQAHKTYSGSHWLADFNHRLQLAEKELGIGPGPKTKKPI